MTQKSDALDHVIEPTHRKGASEEHIYAANQRARTTAMLLGAKSSKAKLRLSARRSLDNQEAGK
jgi:hypothetical protein